MTSHYRRWIRRSSPWLVLLGVVVIAACQPRSRADVVTIKGSDTMVILAQRWAERYMPTHPGSVVQVTGGGSGTGIAALINGTTDICMSSRSMKEEERQQLTQRTSQPPQEIVVARDGLAVYVNDDNPIHELGLDQVRDIYKGTIRNWSEVGGPSAPIVLYGRENNSGTYVYFKEHVLEEQDFASAVQTLPGTAAVVNAVARDRNGIGYGGAAYAQGIRVLGIRKDAQSPATQPALQTVSDGSYPLARPLFFYLDKAPEGAVKQFIDYCLSDSGQMVVSEVEYFPIR